ncbi:MAG: tetratricopeptide repeat protein [Pseudomonadota bacterium]
MPGYSTKDVAVLLGMSEQRVRAFAREGLVSAARGTRNEYRFTFQDIVLLRAAKELTEAKVHPRTVWQALRTLHSELPNDRSLTSVRIVAEGAAVHVRDERGQWDARTGQLGLDFRVADLAAGITPLAQAAAERSHAQDDLDAEEWFDVGLELESIGAIDDAVRAYLSALDIEPLHIDAHINIGRLFQEQHEFGSAESHYREALRLDPSNPTPWFNLGLLLAARAKSQDAIDAYEAALELDPNFADAHYNLAELLEQRGDQQAAFRHFSRYKRLTPQGR